MDRLAREVLAAGASFGEVGRLLGVTRQAARKHWPREETDSTPSPTVRAVSTPGLSGRQARGRQTRR
ncbi:hypothetical protein [Kitasatospora fiedleri]|uniref:hypothetical protein n=1 Tax=Kitasatospora fiedleri TaxID=2991545 RepID=UPI00249A7D73|nr:hypothetical protein [Kitasatospora fiedleri]